MFEGATGAAVLLPLACESLGVVASRELVLRAELVVDLCQVYVLVEGAIVVVAAGLQIVHGRGLIGVRGRRQGEQDRIAGGIPLAVIIKEEEKTVLDNWSANTAAELI